MKFVPFLFVKEVVQDLLLFVDHFVLQIYLCD